MHSLGNIKRFLVTAWCGWHSKSFAETVVHPYFQDVQALTGSNKVHHFRTWQQDVRKARKIKHSWRDTHHWKVRKTEHGECSSDTGLL